MSDPVSSIGRWFKQLAMGRVQAAKAGARGKLMGKQAKLKGKVAGSFNKAVDSGLKKGKSLKKKGGGAAEDAPQDQEKKMGWFGRKKETRVEELEPQAPMAEEATVAIDPSALGLSLSEECVGWVVCRNGPNKGRDHRLTPGKNVLGTAADADIVVTDPYLSSKHCVIRYEDGEFTLVDLDSTNGTYVNGNRVAKYTLVDNDTIRVGRTELRFKSLD